MAKKKKRIQHPVAVKRAAAQAMLAGESASAIGARLSVVPTMLYNWRNAYNDGRLGPKDASAKANGKANGHTDPGMTPERLFTSRVNAAIVNLRQAYKEVRRMEAEGKIKGPDKAHSLAYMALLDLQGDNAI